MNKWHLRFLRLAYFGLALVLPIYALADYTATQGAGTIIRAFDSTHGGTALCAAATTQCQAVGLVNSAGAEIGTAGAPVRIDPTGTTSQPTTVNGTVAVTESGIWTVQPGNTANTTAWKVDGSAVTQPISASALPLPTGAATSALQATNTATTAHTCSTAGYSELGCLGQIDDDVKGAIPAGSNIIGNVRIDQTTPGTTNAVSVTNGPYPTGATPITATATGTTGATTATLAASGGAPKTYVCGFSIRANATAAATGNATMTGVVTATMNFTQWTAPLASGLGVTEMIFSPCIPSSTTNTAIAVISAAPGTGGVVSVSAWGYQL